MGWYQTERQLCAWDRWLRRRPPTRTESYLMQVALEVHRGRLKDPNTVQLHEFELRPKVEPTPRQKVEKLDRQMRALGGRS